MMTMRKYRRNEEFYESRYKEYEEIIDKATEAGIKTDKKNYDQFRRAYKTFAGKNRTRKIEGKYWKSPFEQIVKEDTITYSRKQAKSIRDYLGGLDDEYKKKYKNVKLRDIRHGMLDIEDETKFWEAVKARQSELKEQFSSQETGKTGESTSSRIATLISQEFFGSL